MEFSIWANFGQTLGKLWANFRQTSGKLQANFGQTLGKLSANFRQTSGKLWANFRPSSGKLQANFGQTSGKLQANFGQTSGKLWANFGQNLRMIYEDEPACVILTLLDILLIYCLFFLLNYFLSLITTRKQSLGQGNIFMGVCQEFCSKGGVCLSACWDIPPGADPPKQTPPGADNPWEQTPPGADTIWEQTPIRADTLQSRHHLPPGADTPLPPCTEHAGRYGQCAGGMNPIRMQSFYLFRFQIVQHNFFVFY